MMTKTTQRLTRLLKIQQANLNIAVSAFEKQRQLVDHSGNRIRQLENHLEEIYAVSKNSNPRDTGKFINRVNRLNEITRKLKAEKLLNQRLIHSLATARTLVLKQRTKVKGIRLRIESLTLKIRLDQDKSNDVQRLDHVLQNYGNDR